ncbi:hypothetical protein [Shewanella japonica]|uniref:Uncharacterized protein n=1 Tax=Shewanella japonica TaxID=93973 RepID=A0ABM6JR58_9GAMM|nr:hypothetical protein [Shewanella japonica]ARD24333.1 hypothetical protein SJ2017_4106 [Shewanella japonica]
MKPSNTPKNDDDIVGLLPPTKSILAFLATTMLMLFSVGTLNIVILDFYLDINAEWTLLYLLITVLIFSGLNFSVVKGSFLAVRIFKRYLTILFVIFLPSVLLMDSSTQTIPIYFFGMGVALSTFYLLNSKHYQIFVEYQFDAMEDRKEALAELEAEIKAFKSKRK